MNVQYARTVYTYSRHHHLCSTTLQFHQPFCSIFCSNLSKLIETPLINDSNFRRAVPLAVIMAHERRSLKPATHVFPAAQYLIYNNRHNVGPMDHAASSIAPHFSNFYTCTPPPPRLLARSLHSTLLFCLPILFSRQSFPKSGC